MCVCVCVRVCMCVRVCACVCTCMQSRNPNPQHEFFVYRTSTHAHVHVRTQGIAYIRRQQHAHACVKIWLPPLRSLLKKGSNAACSSSRRARKCPSEFKPSWRERGKAGGGQKKRETGRKGEMCVCVCLRARACACVDVFVCVCVCVHHVALQTLLELPRKGRRLADARQRLDRRVGGLSKYGSQQTGVRWGRGESCECVSRSPVCQCCNPKPDTRYPGSG
jgi:hypothetical protein